MSENYYDSIPEGVFFDNCSILDIGASDGKNQLFSRHRRFFENNRNYTGVEIRENLPSNGLNIITMNIFDYDTNKKFDVITALAVIEHIPFSKWLTLIKMMKSWLAPRGVIVVIVPHKEQLHDYIVSIDLQECLQINMPCHVTHGITARAIDYILPGATVIEQRRHIKFRESGEPFPHAFLRFLKRFFTGHKYVWDGLRRKEHLLISVWRSEEQ